MLWCCDAWIWFGLLIGTCRADGGGCSCDDNRTFSTADVCASKSSNSHDSFFESEDNILIFGCVGGALLLLCILIVWCVYNNNEEFDTKDCVVESIDLTNAGEVRESSNLKKKKNMEQTYTQTLDLEIPPLGGSKASTHNPHTSVGSSSTTSSNGKANEGHPSQERDVDAGRYQAYQVHKQSPLSPAKSAGLSPRRLSPSRDALKQHVSSSDVTTSTKTKKALPLMKQDDREASSVGDSSGHGDEEEEDEEEEDDEEEEVNESTAMISSEDKEPPKETSVVVVHEEEKDVLLGDDDDDDEHEHGDDDGDDDDGDDDGVVDSEEEQREQSEEHDIPPLPSLDAPPLRPPRPKLTGWLSE